MVSKTHLLHVIVEQVEQESIKLGIFQNTSVSSENENSLKTNIYQENNAYSCSFHQAFQNIWFKSLKLRLFNLEKSLDCK